MQNIAKPYALLHACATAFQGWSGMFDWNDLRYFLAVARTGSATAAAELIPVNQSTVSRRVAALERALAAKLFDRTVAGYQLTDLGRELVPLAERAEGDAEAVMLMIDQANRRIAGTVRVTTNETMAELFLTPSLAEFAALYPEVRVDVIVSSRWLDLSRGEADVALRAARELGNERAVARKLSELPWAIYCSHAYAAAYGAPTSSHDLSQHRVVSVDGLLSGLAALQWMEKSAGTAAVVARTNSLQNLETAVRAGLGVSALPCVRGEAAPALVRCIGPNADLNSFVWLVTRNQIKNESAVQAFRSFIVTKAPVLRQLLHV